MVIWPNITADSLVELVWLAAQLETKLLLLVVVEVVFLIKVEFKLAFELAPFESLFNVYKLHDFSDSESNRPVGVLDACV